MSTQVFIYSIDSLYHSRGVLSAFFLQISKSVDNGRSRPSGIVKLGLLYLNGGTNCPACRGVSTAVIPFRALQTVIDSLLRLAPEKARTEREREQADEIYKAGATLRIPSPREPSPEPNLAQNPDLAYPCPHCPAGNPHGWRCPRPIADPAADPDNAWHLDEGNPPGHGTCANCDNILALEAPTTTKCDFFGQNPHGFSNIPDLIESSEIYDSFEGNTYEVEIVFDYLRSHNITPKQIYRAIIAHVQSQPQGFVPLVESDVFSEIHGGGPVPQGPFNRICRACAADVLLWGLKDWWIRERRRGQLDEAILRRPDCGDGSTCPRQKDAAHAREFNHVISLPQEAGPSTPPNPAPLAAPSSADTVANLVVPQTQPVEGLQHRAMLSFLLNASDSEETALPTIAQVLHSSSTTDIRDAIDAFSS
ncbi:hypothetical protein H1R20_g1959, partial [Candolleomyces eurysporus]